MTLVSRLSDITRKGLDKKSDSTEMVVFSIGLLFPGIISGGSCLMGLQNYQYQEKPGPGMENG